VPKTIGASTSIEIESFLMSSAMFNALHLSINCCSSVFIGFPFVVSARPDESSIGTSANKLQTFTKHFFEGWGWQPQGRETNPRVAMCRGVVETQPNTELAPWQRFPGGHHTIAIVTQAVVNLDVEVWVARCATIIFCIPNAPATAYAPAFTEC